jgi:hypothetical protein
MAGHQSLLILAHPTCSLQKFSQFMPLGRSCFKWVAVLGDDLLMFDQLLMLFRVTINVVLHVYQLIDGSSSKPMHTIYIPTTYCTSNLLIFKNFQLITLNNVL